jgi:carbamoyl-phosphate synthase small subunit
MNEPTAKLALADGTVFTGRAFGAAGERAGEVVFNTAMTGYQEILTDPSYRGQIVVMTTAHVGNYGINRDDVESRRAWVEGFVARSFTQAPSNPRATGDLDGYLKQAGIVAIDGIDTRALTLRLRRQGSMNGVISTTDADDASLTAKARAIPSMEGADLVRDVTIREPKPASEIVPNVDGSGVPVALIDCGVKYNIVRLLASHRLNPTLYPATAKADEILGRGPARPRGVVVSNGPGDPAALPYLVETLRALADRDVPLFGICLGHQVLSLALGARTFKLKFGHHGANHPVKNTATGRVEITSQNHGFAVAPESAERAGLKVTHVNLNDQTIEGFRHRSRPVFAVQYHPEASPGPHDSRYLFDEFVTLIAR